MTNTLTGDKVYIETTGYQTKKKMSHIESLMIKTVDPSIPPYYHQHTQAFNEEASFWFPSAQEEDHVIILKPDAPPELKCKVYAQTAAEEEATCTFINDHLKKGYIVESNSPYASPFFFRKKKDRKLWPIMDYQVLNSWTVRDAYPLSLINTILKHLQGKELFTKFDIWWGYENLCIKEENQWKAAFKTPLGLFQPCVMFFGLTNFPATFCCAMAWMFQPLTNIYPTKLFIYMDDILISTKDNMTCHCKIVDTVLDLLAKESYFLHLLCHSRDVHSNLELGLYWECGTKGSSGGSGFWVEVMKCVFKASDDKYLP